MTDPARTEIVVVLGHASQRVTVDPITGAVASVDHDEGLSAHDAAALELGVTFAREWSVPATAIIVGDARADIVLQNAAARGVSRLVRIDDNAATSSAITVARQIAAAIAALEVTEPIVIAGAHGTDWATAATPAALAQFLGTSQALGLVEVHATAVGVVEGLRRGDRGLREHVRASAPTVVSVEASAATLARAHLRAVLDAQHAPVQVMEPEAHSHVPRFSASPVPYRPRTRVVAAPANRDAFSRIVELTAAVEARTPPQTVELGADEAARVIMDQLNEWGVGPDHS